MEDFKKPNNSKNDELQPYNPENGQYEEKDKNLDDLDDLKSITNFYARMLGGLKKEFPLKFPKNNFPIEYLHYYFNKIINRDEIDVSDDKMLFLIDEKDPKKRYLIFKNLLGYNESNIKFLKEQILKNAPMCTVYVNKKADKYGFRVKIYMPIKFANSSKTLIIKTCWIIKENEKPRLVTAWYKSKFEEDLKDEI